MQIFGEEQSSDTNFYYRRVIVHAWTMRPGCPLNTGSLPVMIQNTNFCSLFFLLNVALVFGCHSEMPLRATTEMYFPCVLQSNDVHCSEVSNSINLDIIFSRLRAVIFPQFRSERTSARASLPPRGFVTARVGPRVTKPRARQANFTRVNVFFWDSS